MTDVITNLQGHLLIASHMLDESFFERSVIFVCEHNIDGTMGIVINQPAEEVNFKQITDDMGIDGNGKAKPIIFNGGPVEQNRGFIVHSSEYTSPETVEVSHGISLSATVHIVDDIAKGSGPEELNFCLGYAGWGEGQLETELTKDCWYALPATPDLVFDTPAEKRYEACLKKLGLDKFSGVQGLA